MEPKLNVVLVHGAWAVVVGPLNALILAEQLPNAQLSEPNPSSAKCAVASSE
jgi:hypothetical protein